MSLTLLTDTEVAEFVSGLDLAEGSEAYRTLNSMLLLPSAAFARAISGLAQGLYDFAAVRALPAMNERLVDALIASRLGDNDPSALAWRYREEWLPASIDVATMRSTAIGNAAAAIAAKFVDRWGGVVRPNYDFLKTDETKFQSYAEAHVGYMVIANGPIPASKVQAFEAIHAATRAATPQILHATDALCPVLQLVKSLLTEAVFLERQTGGRKVSVLLDWVVSASWRTVLPGNFARFMTEVAFPAMAASTDPDRSGLPACLQLTAETTWLPVGDDGDPGWWLDLARMARIHLPEAYGMDATTERSINQSMVAYLEAARTAIIDFQTYVAREMVGSALPYRAVPGSPMGLLLCATSP
jgi:hypothetical protein